MFSEQRYDFGSLVFPKQQRNVSNDWRRRILYIQRHDLELSDPYNPDGFDGA